MTFVIVSFYKFSLTILSMIQARNTSSMRVDAYLHARRAGADRGLLIVDDHDLVRLGMQALIQSEAQRLGVRLQIFEASNMALALDLYSANRRHVDYVLLDLGLPDTIGLSGLARFRSAFPEARITVLSGDASKTTIQGAMALGAVAYLKKSSHLEEVVDDLRRQGLFQFKETPEDQGDAAEPAVAEEGLSQRQLQIVGLVLEGKTNREISEITFLAEGTVKNHVSTALLHFGARSRSHLISMLR